MISKRSLTLALVLVLAFPASAHAITEIIPGEGATSARPLSLFIGDFGTLQAKRGLMFENVPGMFFGSNTAPAAAFWHLRVKGAPAPNVTFGPRDTTPVAISNTPVTGEWTEASPARVVTLMNVQHDGVNLFEVRQTTLYVGPELRFRVVWQVRNIDPQNRTIPFVFGTSADLAVDGVDAGRGVFVDGPSRFIGGTNRGASHTTQITGGLQEALSSRLPGEAAATAVPRWASYEEGGFFEIINRLRNADAFANTVDPTNIDNAVGVSFDDRATAGLAPGQTARYEVIWHYDRPTRLTASPAAATRELPASHTVTLSFVDANLNPVANQTVRVRRTGVNGTGVQSVTTNAQGLAQVTWTGSTPGLDTLHAWIDENANGVQDPDEQAASAAVRWIADNHVSGPPAVTPPPGATPTVRPNADNPEAPTFQFAREGTAQAGFAECTFDQRTGRSINLPVASTLQPGSGTISNARLFLLDRARHNPSDLATPLPAAALADANPSRTGNVFTFRVPCVVSGEMWLEFTFTEGAASQTFRVPIGGLQLTDPQGVVHDGARYDAAIAAGATPPQARAAAAIEGATVRLQRETLGVFLHVLSGDPGIAPNVNPQTTGANGLFQWDVSPGRYRVLVSAPGCQDAIGGPAEIPPPALDVHVRLDCGSGGGGGAGGGGNGAAAADRTPPVLSRLRLSPRAFRSSGAVTAAAARSARRTGRGTKITFTLSERASVVVGILRRTTGRRVGASCRTPTAATRSRARCTRYVTAVTLRRAALPAGSNRIAFSGRIGTRRLAPGSYRVVARPTDAAGNRGAQRATAFRIVGR